MLHLASVCKNSKGNIDWKKVSENLGRSVRKCQRQYSKINDDFSDFIVNDDKPTTCHTRQNSAQMEQNSANQSGDVAGNAAKKQKAKTHGNVMHLPFVETVDIFSGLDTRIFNF